MITNIPKLWGMKWKGESSGNWVTVLLQGAHGRGLNTCPQRSCTPFIILF